MITSPEVFVWIVTALVFCTSSAWVVVDIVRLRRALAEGRAAHDRVFGSIIGLAVALIGIVGVLKFHLG